MHKFPYKFNLTDLPIMPYNGLKVFSCFSAGGGSSIGYKMVGCNVLGGVEINKQFANDYINNLHPKHMFIEDIRLFNARTDLPEELYNLDILDGSPPCTSFSMAGERHRGWGKEKHFTEGASKQTLDDLLMVYAETIKKLNPKSFVLENVAGLVSGRAKDIYFTPLIEFLRELNYRVVYNLVNGKDMGIAQDRKRIIIIGIRNDVIENKNIGFLNGLLSFNEPIIPFSDIVVEDSELFLSEKDIEFGKFERAGSGKFLESYDILPHGKRYNKLLFKCYNATVKIHPDGPIKTILSGNNRQVHPYEKRFLTNSELALCSSWPMDYKTSINLIKYIGYSVPPVMIAQIADKLVNILKQADINSK